MAIGRYQVGDFVPVVLLTRTPDGVLHVPDDDPDIKLYRNGSLVTTTTMEQLDPNRNVELYVLRYQPNAIGVWTAVMSYDVTADMVTTTYTVVESFTVVAGGSDVGALVAVHAMRLLEHDYLVCQADGGTLRYGRNPY